MRRVSLFLSFLFASVVLVFLLSLSGREEGVLVLSGRVEGESPSGRVPVAFHFYEKGTGELVYRVVATAEIREGRYRARIPSGSLRRGGEFYVCATSPAVFLESFQEQGGGVLGVVLLQSATPGIQQVGHVNISGTLISGSVKTSAFQMATGAGAGRVLTSDASGNASWQDPPPPSGSAGGDLSGTYPNPVVAGLQTRPVSSTAPGNGQVLKWNGTAWAPAVDDAGSLTLPFTGSANVGSGPVFSITNTATSGFADGIWGRTNSTSATGVLGWATATTGTNFGGFFRTDSTGGRGVIGYATATTGGTYGVIGSSDSNGGTGVYGVANASTGATRGVYGEAVSPGGIAVSGYEGASTGRTYGGHFRSDSSTGTGVFGYAPATNGTTYGVYGQSDSPAGTGVFGLATAGSGFTYGVVGQTDSIDGRGVFGLATATSGFTYGVVGRSDSTDGTGVVGVATAGSGDAWGVSGVTNSSASGAYGVFGLEPSGGAGHAVYAFGTLAATGTKSFQMDHPLDPENYYLNHFCTEGPEPMNAYSGNVVTDANGYATIALPDYFDSINRDFRYQLTVVDDGERDDFVLVKVVRKIRNNQFTIRTSAPHVEVSWRVEAIRNDRWVQKYGYRTVQEKEDEIKGKYLNPELYGMPKEYGIHYRPDVERPASLEKQAPRLPAERSPSLQRREAPSRSRTAPAPSKRSQMPRAR